MHIHIFPTARVARDLLKQKIDGATRRLQVWMCLVLNKMPPPRLVRTNHIKVDRANFKAQYRPMVRIGRLTVGEDGFIYTHTYIHRYTYVYIYIYMYTCMYMHIYIYTHTHIFISI